MPVLINQPANRISLTNISLVRLKKGKKRFEIACYKNKLLEYRSGLETDLDNVLQVPTIFLNVSKGQTAPKEDLQKSFGKGVSQDDMVAEILKRGEVQVGAGERKELLDRVEREVVELVSERVVDPETKRVYTTGMIKKALDLLTKQAGHAQQGLLDTSRHLSTADNEDEGTGGGGLGDEEQAGYMGLGKLDINDSDENDGGRPQKGQGKKSRRNKTHDNTSVNNNKRQQQAPGSARPPEAARPDTQDDSKSTDTSRHNIPTWTGVSTTKTPKALALEAMKALIYHQPIPIQRARMRLRISIPASIAKQTVRTRPAPTTAADDNNNPDDSTSTTSNASRPRPHQSGTTTTMTVKQKVITYIEQIESEDISSPSLPVGDNSSTTTTTAGGGGGSGSSGAHGESWEILAFVEPGSYKGLAEFVGAETRGRGRVEVLDMAVTHED